jgi:hypothetical protein
LNIIDTDTTQLQSLVITARLSHFASSQRCGLSPKNARRILAPDTRAVPNLSINLLHLLQLASRRSPQLQQAHSSDTPTY